MSQQNFADISGDTDSAVPRHARLYPSPMGAHTKHFDNNVYLWEYLPSGYNPAEAKQYPLMISLHGAR